MIPNLTGRRKQCEFICFALMHDRQKEEIRTVGCVRAASSRALAGTRWLYYITTQIFRTRIEGYFLHHGILVYKISRYTAACSIREASIGLRTRSRLTTDVIQYHNDKISP